jgi:hypothetical protein
MVPSSIESDRRGITTSGIPGAYPARGAGRSRSMPFAQLADVQLYYEDRGEGLRCC